jgi:hypothetical protein
MLAALLLTGCDNDDCPSCPEEGPIMYLDRHRVDFGAADTVATFAIVNRGDGSLAWDLNHNGAPWLSLSISSGSLSGDQQAVINCAADRSQLNQPGIYRATITINSNGNNAVRDSLHVYLLDGGDWLIADEEQFDFCLTPNVWDYYWIKGFALPEGIEAAFVDSVQIHFCAADTIVQVISFASEYRSDLEVYVPTGVTYASEFAYEVISGWNSLPVRFYVSQPVFFVGYFQLGASLPRLSLDTLTALDTIGSWRGYDDAQNPSNPAIILELDPDSQTLAIRAFISPVLEYLPKAVVDGTSTQRRVLEEAFGRKGSVYRGSDPKLILR